MSQFASQPLPFPADGDSQSGAASSGGREPIKWVIVSRTAGLAPAHIIAGRLQAEGIPVRVWQEAAGQAIGLTVGILGTGHVAVPEEFVAQAESLLDNADAEQVESPHDELREDI